MSYDGKRSFSKMHDVPIEDADSSKQVSISSKQMSISSEKIVPPPEPIGAGLEHQSSKGSKQAAEASQLPESGAPRKRTASENVTGAPTVTSDIISNNSKELVAGARTRVGTALSSATKISCESIEAPPPDDPAEIICARRYRVIIFAIVCQAVQMFMSYDGGATPASLDTIQEEMDNAWTASEFGLLGSMDKIGMTVFSMFWGRALQIWPEKFLLCIGLFVNAGATLAFAFLRHKYLMYTVKFFLGATQALQGVWGAVWTVTMAPPDKKTMWLGLGAVSAGVGNGIGTAVAGFGTAAGSGYAFAFILQAGVLFALWFCLFFTPARTLVTQLPAEITGTTTSRIGEAPSLDARDMTSAMQLRDLSKNRVYCWTCMAISLTMFEMSGVQFIWVRIFVEVWELPKGFVTLMFLLVTGIGGGIGVACGPAYIDKKGGFSAPPGVVDSLSAIYEISKLGAYAGVGGAVCLYFKGDMDGGSQLWGDWGDHWLWILWACIFTIWASHNACIAALCGINIEVVPGKIRTMASGTEMTFRNILGYAFGPLLPGLVMDFIQDTPETQLRYGLAFVLIANVLQPVLVQMARHHASVFLHQEQERALKELQIALVPDPGRTIKERVKVLQKAEQNGKRVHLQFHSGGAAALGSANEAIGTWLEEDRRGRKRLESLGKIDEEDFDALERRCELLVKDNRSLKEQLKELKHILLFASFRAFLGQRNQPDELETEALASREAHI